MDKNKKIKENLIYNSIGNFIFLAFQWLITILVVKLSGYGDAGILSLSMSFANSLYALSSFGMRGYQASDYKYRFNNNVYIKSRFLTCIVGYILFSLFIIFNDYSIYLKGCILIYLLYKSVEAFDDVYYGAIQREWDMKSVGISYALHGFVSIISFIIGLKVFNSLLLSFVLMALTSIVITIFYDRKSYTKLNIKEVNKSDTLKNLLIVCFPLVIYAFLFNNIQVYPRYLLERITSKEILGIYSSIASPVLLVQVVAGYIFNPLLNVFTDYVLENKKSEYKKLVSKVYILIIILGLLGLIYIYFLGDFSLKILFDNGILKYKTLLYSTLLMAILMSIVTFNNMLLTVSRKFYILLRQNFICLLLTLLFSKGFIIKYGIYGINKVLIISLIIGIIITLKDVYDFDKKGSNTVEKIKKFIIQFGVKHSKTILKFVPKSLIN